MKKRNLWGAVAALAALYAVKMVMKVTHDVRRYNHILSMSNEGTVAEEAPELLLQVMKQERQTLREWLNFIRSAPKDFARYLKIESM
jgi:hypothetical protein